MKTEMGVQANPANPGKYREVHTRAIIGWDIGAANVKASRLSMQPDGSARVEVVSQPFEIWKAKDRLPEVLKAVLGMLPSSPNLPAMAMTTTAELSDVFATKREGVLFVLDALHQSFPDHAIYAWSLSGRFLPLNEARLRPLDFAAANWLALAQWIAHRNPDGLVIDVGSTTTDILPILNGTVAVCGRTDMERLASGELVYTGALRTNLAAIVHAVPAAGKRCRVSSEYFAIAADVHLILGHLSELSYRCSTPDGASPSIDSARRRLARLICADVEMLSSCEIDGLARYIYERQLDQICEGMNQVLARFPRLRNHAAVILGVGSFLGKEAARRAGLEIAPLEGLSPSVAVAYLLAESLKAGA